MYKCENCGKTADHREKQNKVSIYRDCCYENTRNVFNEKTKKYEKEYFTTQGYEIVSEQNHCNDCYDTRGNNGN